MDLKAIIAILLPPLAVFLRVGIGRQFYINVALTLCGYFPGLVHGLLITLYSPPKHAS